MSGGPVALETVQEPLPSEDLSDIRKRVLGKCYQRKTRKRQLLLPRKPLQNGGLILPFTTLKCADIKEPQLHLPPIMQGLPLSIQEDTEDTESNVKVLRKRFQLCDILPEVAANHDRQAKDLSSPKVCTHQFKSKRKQRLSCNDI